MAAYARENLERTRHKHKAASFEVLEGDASSFRVPDDVTLVYIANPFGGKVFAGAIQRVIESCDRRPRPVRIAYAEPREHDALLATGRVRELPHADTRWMHLAGVDPDRLRRYEVIPAPTGR